MRKIKRKPRRVRKKKSIWRSRFFRLAVFVVILFAEVFYLLIFSPLFQVKDIIIVAPEGIPKRIFQEIVKKAIAKKILFFRTKSIFLVRSGNIKQTISEKYSQFGKIRIKIKMPSLLILELRNRQAIANLCQDLSLAEGKCFFIDEEGIIFKDIFAVQKAPDLFIVSRLEQAKEGGQSSVKKQEISLILEIRKFLSRDLGLENKGFIVTSDKLTAKMEDWEIYFDLQGSISEQLFNLKVLLEQQASLKEHKIQYIDLRFGNKIFYRAN